MENTYEQACKLLVSEKAKTNHEKAVAPSVERALKLFAQSEPEFAEAIIAKGKNGFTQCLQEVVKDAGSSLSDIEVYRRAVNFYFPGAGVRFIMRIDLCASANGEKDILAGGLGFETMLNGPDSSDKPELQPAGTPAGKADASDASEVRKPIELDLDSLFD